MARNIIFYYPYIVSKEPKTGEQVRVSKMLTAFKEIGYNVYGITGKAAERKRSISRIRTLALRGSKFGFVYCESTNMPILLTESHHLPLYPFFDFGFLKWAKRNHIPIGLYYRDIHWRFRQKSFNKEILCVPFFGYDLLCYSRLATHFFLPNTAMQKAIPVKWNESKISELPPGCELYELAERRRSGNVSATLKLLYVGGIGSPKHSIYDLSSMFKIANELKEVYLTICCRSSEWNKVASKYSQYADGNINMVLDKHGELLAGYYMDSDIFIMIGSAHPYLDFAMPVKYFEAIGYALPVITTAGTEIAKFVEHEGIGWVVATEQDAVNLLRHLSNNRQKIEEKHKYIEALRGKHSWIMRARTVADILNSYK